MNGRLLTRLTNTLIVTGVGMGAGHSLFPSRPGAGLVRRAGFVCVVAGSGALAAWRERRSLELYADEEIRSSQWLWITVGMLVALALAWASNRVVHG